MFRKESRTTSPAPRPLRLAIAAVGATVGTLLSGCGGSSSSPAPAPAPTPAPAPAPALTLTGVVATGMAMPGAAVSIKCTGGNATATSATDGSYSASITGGALPCMVRATSSDGTLVYHAALNSGAASDVINVTPLTELILAVAVGDPTQVDATFTNNTTLPSAVAADLATAQTTVVTVLTGGGIALSGIDPVSTPLTASSSATAAGDSQDQAIDALMANLSANASGLLELATVLDTGVSSASTQQQASAILVTAPAVTQCPRARAGTYWWINHNGGFTTITLNSTLSSVTIADINELNGNDPETDALTWGNGCEATFTQQNTAVQQLTFASGGEFVAGNAPTSTLASSMHIAIPMQKVALADLAGNWNAIEYDSRENTGDAASATVVDTFVFDAQGHLTCTAAEVADGCVNPTFTANDDGSFTATSGGVLHVFRGANGKLNFIHSMDYPNGGGLVIGVPVSTATLPVTGASYTYVQYQFSGIPATNSTHNWASFDIDTYAYSVSAIDSPDKTVTRTYSTKNGALYDLVDVVDYDQPSTGFRTRPALSYTDASGTTYNKPTSYTLPLGTGMSVFGDGADGTYSSTTATSTSAPFFGISVTLN